MKFLYDLFPLLLFFAAYKFYDIYTATAVAIAASFAQTGLYWLKHRRFENMHLITLAVITIFGGLTITLHDNSFIMWKPTIVNWLFAAVALGSHLVGKRTIVQRMLGNQIELPERIWTRLNLSWGIFFLVMGALNLYVAFYFAPELDAATRETIWVNFKVWGLLGLTFVFVIAQAFFMARHATPKSAPAATTPDRTAD